MILVYDTETTGKIDRGAPADAPHQPHLVQLGAELYQPNGTPIATLNVIVRPKGWTIPADAAAVHGITQERAEAEGADITDALSIFHALSRIASVHVAHNKDFDEKIMRGAFRRVGALIYPEPHGAFCTMLESQRMIGGRWPKLAAAYKYFFGETLEGAHDALVDLRACARIYFHLKALENSTLPARYMPRCKQCNTLLSNLETELCLVCWARDPSPPWPASSVVSAIKSEPESVAFVYPPPPPPPPYTPPQPPITYMQSL